MMVEISIRDRSAIIIFNASFADRWFFQIPTEVGNDAVMIIGGLGNLPGTVAAAVLLAVTEGIVTSFADPTIARITSLCLMCLVLILRPHGLFQGATQ